MSFVSYGQNNEDVLLWRVLKNVERGFYIDVGAAHPDELSVTRAFYERGWSGINVEPLADYHDSLERDRVRDVNLRAVLGARPGLARLHVVPDTGLSTVDNDVAARHALAGWSSEAKLVPQLTLTDIMEQRGDAPIHFLKIDVEGAERAVLEGGDFQRFRPWVIVVEATGPLLEQDCRADWEEILLMQGYESALFDGLNGFYVAREWPEILDRLLVPANVFDDYIGIREHSALATLAARTTRHEADCASCKHHEASEQQTSTGLVALRSQHEQLLERARLLDYRLQATLSSHSWRLTEPARLASRALRDFLGRHAGVARLAGLGKSLSENFKTSSIEARRQPSFQAGDLSHTAGIVLNRLKHHLPDQAVA